MVTGGAGFIGGNFIRHILAKKEFTGRIINIDALTYAGNPLSLRDVEEAYGTKRYIFRRIDIRDRSAIDRVMEEYEVDCIVHFAAESHVDRSIYGPGDFVTTNINGTFTLLESARAHWEGKEGKLFHHVSTDEVYGSLGETGSFFEDTPYDPKSPYSASKAASDHLVRAWNHTYGLPVTLSNCSNNYGPYQFPEKLIPLMISNALDGKALPIYGTGENIRDWLYVVDHAEAIWCIITRGQSGASYNIGGENEWKNIELVKRLCALLARATKRSEDDFLKLITFVKDRPGHDQRYAINCDKIKKELVWKQSVDFTQGLELTIRWYLDNQAWVEEVRSGEYARWIEKNYGSR